MGKRSESKPKDAAPKSARVSFEELRGILKSRRRKPMSVREMDEAIQRSVRVRWKAARSRST